jgi:hypothetical protein
VIILSDLVGEKNGGDQMFHHPSKTSHFTMTMAMGSLLSYHDLAMGGSLLSYHDLAMGASLLRYKDTLHSQFPFEKLD